MVLAALLLAVIGGCVTSTSITRNVLTAPEVAVRHVLGWPEPVAGPCISCDLRIIQVSDGSAVAYATGDAMGGKLDVLAKDLAGKLKDGVGVKRQTLAVVSLRNRGGTAQGQVVADELTDKVQGALIQTGWFDVKERIDLRPILDEKDLDTAGMVRNENVRKKLAGVKYIVIGGITVTDKGK